MSLSNPTGKDFLQVHAARLRDMADQNQLNASVWREQSTSLSPWSGLTHRQCHQEGLRCEREAAALLAGAEALERQERDLDAIKAADAALTEAIETISDLRGRLEVAKAALLRENAQLMRERCEPERKYKADWAVLWERQYKGRTLSVTQARTGVAYWYVDSFPDYEATVADSLDAAKAAAIAWVDGQEGK